MNWAHMVVYCIRPTFATILKRGVIERHVRHQHRTVAVTDEVFIISQLEVKMFTGFIVDKGRSVSKIKRLSIIVVLPFSLARHHVG